jgi:ABC-2 type transport system ATP-binding protein
MSPMIQTGHLGPLYKGPATGAAVLQVAGLSKVFGRHRVVDGLNLRLDRGEVFGLVGPVGAGKTMTIRMLVGLVRPTAGEVRLFGEELHRRGAARRLLPRVGALIDRPAFQPFLTGRDNLLVVSGYTGGGESSRRVDTTLDLVGLAKWSDHRYSSYSPGMRQRLGIAAALLTGPELIILDEPTEGLDPAGMIELKALVHRLRDNGRSVFIASRTLADVSEMCTRIGILQEGRLVMVGPVEELQRATSRWEIVSEQPEQVGILLAELPGVLSVHVSSGQVTLDAPEVRGRQIISYLAQHGIWPDMVRLSAEDLEHTFLRLAEREAGL